MSNKKNPCVFLDLSLDGIAAKRIVIEVKWWWKEVPHCTTKELNSLVSIRAPSLKHQHLRRATLCDEKTNTRCSEYGVLAVHTCTKGLKFHIILDSWPHHDSVQAVFGKVIDGMETVKKIDSMGTPTGKPSRKVIITNSGEIPEEDKNKYVMESDKVKTEEPRKTLTRSNYASKYYHYKRKHLASSEFNSDPEIYKSLLAIFRAHAKACLDKKKKAMAMQSDKGSEPTENLKGRKDKIRKKPSDDTSQEQVSKKQRVPTSAVGDEKEHQTSKSFEEEMEANLDEELEAKLMVKVAEMSFTGFEHNVECDKGDCAMEFRYSKRKYWSSSSNSYLEYRSDPLVDADTEFYRLRHRRICSEWNL